MKKETISAKETSTNTSASIEILFPESLEEAVKAYGEEPVLSNALAHWKIILQSNIRSGLKRGETPEQIQERLKDAKMGVSQRGGGRIDPVQAFLAKFQAATPEQQNKMLEELKKRAAQA